MEGVCIPSGMKGIYAVRREPVFPVVTRHPWGRFLGHTCKLIVAGEVFISKTSIWLVSLFQFVSYFSVYSVHLCHHRDFFRLAILFYLYSVAWPFSPRGSQHFCVCFSHFFRLLDFWLSKQCSDTNTIFIVTTYRPALVNVFVYKLIAMVFMCPLGTCLFPDPRDCVKTT